MVGKDNKRAFEVIDVHVHVTERLSGFGYRGEARAIGKGKVRWANGDVESIIPESLGDKSFEPDKLIEILDNHNIEKAIMLQGSFLGFCNDYTYEAQQTYPGRLFGMGTFDPFCEDYKKIMLHLIEDYKFKGFKFEMSTAFGLMGFHNDFKLDGERMQDVFKYADRKNLNVSLDMGTFGDKSLQIDALAKIASKYKGIRFVIEHIFYPGVNRYEDFKFELGKLEGYENIAFTIASIPNSIMPEEYPYPSACKYLKIAKEVVGTDRLMWGSDVPGVLGNASYNQLIDYVADSKLFSEADLKKIYAENAKRIYML